MRNVFGYIFIYLAGIHNGFPDIMNWKLKCSNKLLASLSHQWLICCWGKL